MSTIKKTIWAHVSIEVESDGVEDESLMDFINEELTEYGFIVDDMGIREEENK